MSVYEQKSTEIRDLPLCGMSSKMHWLFQVLWPLGARLPGSRVFSNPGIHGKNPCGRWEPDLEWPWPLPNMALAAAKYGLGRCQKLNFLGTGAQRRYDASASGGFARGVSPLARIFFKILDIFDTFSDFLPSKCSCTWLFPFCGCFFGF